MARIEGRDDAHQVLFVDLVDPPDALVLTCLDELSLVRPEDVALERPLGAVFDPDVVALWAPSLALHEFVHPKTYHQRALERRQEEVIPEEDLVLLLRRVVVLESFVSCDLVVEEAARSGAWNLT